MNVPLNSFDHKSITARFFEFFRGENRCESERYVSHAIRSLSLSVSLRDVRCDGADRTRWIDQRSRSRRGTRTGSGSAIADSRDGDTRYTGDVGHLVFAATVQLARLIRFRRDFAAEASEEGSAICAGNLRVARSSLVPRLCSSTVRRAVDSVVSSLSHVGCLYVGSPGG